MKPTENLLHEVHAIERVKVVVSERLDSPYSRDGELVSNPNDELFERETLLEIGRVEVKLTKPFCNNFDISLI
jgi:hypothetical protein